MKFLQVAFLFFTVKLAAVTVAEKRSENLMIVGGEEAPEEYGKFHVSLWNLVKRSHFCGGAVISDWFVVTAAHCIFRTKVLPEEIKMVVGTTRLDKDGIGYDVKSIILHPGYIDYDLINDIALLKSSKPFDKHNTARLLISRLELQEGDLVTVMGFGRIKSGGPLSQRLLYLNAPVINQVTCRNALEWTESVITREMFCTYSRKGQGDCDGDSGSPLIIGDELVGVVSWGTTLCADGYPDVHTRITPYINWIRSYILPNN